MSKSHAEERNVAIDGLRGLAIFLVLLCHLPTSEKKPVFEAGWSGVDLFFVLSGFLVSGLIFNEWKRKQDCDVVRFLVRRGFKIYPAYFFFIAVGSFLARVQLTYGHISYSTLLAQALFVMNYVPGVFEHTWSLAVEEHFYLLLPFFLIPCLRYESKYGKKVILTTIAAGIATIPLVRILNFFMQSEISWMTCLYPTHLRMDSLLIGVALSYSYCFYRPDFDRFFRRHGGVCLVAAVGMISSVLSIERKSAFCLTMGYTVLATGFALLLGVALTNHPFTRPLSFSPLAWVGRISYSVYLWHRIGDSLFENLVAGRVSLFAHSYFLRNVGSVACALAIGYLGFRCVEEPFLKIRDHFFAKTKVPLDTSILFEKTVNPI